MDRIEEAFVSLCGAAREAQRSHNTVLAKRLEAEVCDRYDDPELSLDSLSSVLGLSPSYTSQLFKQYTGENFYTHVEHIRVEKARYLLETTTLTVNEVAGRVGYRTDQSFRRAFKRVTGLRPTAIRAALAARSIEESTEFHKD
jgi:AraC-like DNA-binding protein